MSILRNLFGKKAKLPEYESHVRSYVDQYEDKPVYTIVDLGLLDMPEHTEFTVYIAVILPVQINQNEDPPVSQQELSALHALEADTIDDAQRLGYLYAGHAIVTAAEHMYIAFYCHASGKQAVTDSLNRICIKHGRQPTRVLVKEDPEWSFYTDRLSPDDYQMQLINHVDILQELRDHADDGSDPRPVYFWLYFKSREDGEKAAEKAKAEGLEQKELTDTTNDEDGPADPDYPFSLQLSLTMALSLDALNTRAWKLIDIAKECGGQYDGAETEIVKPGTSAILRESPAPEEAPAEEPKEDPETEEPEESPEKEEDQP